MTRLSEMSRDKYLYVCDNTSCRVVTFTLGSGDIKDTCPGCKKIGLLLRGPIAAPATRAADRAETVS